jgi:hypothetical protein
MILALLLVQTAAAPITAPVTKATSAAPAQRFSILAEPCARAAGETVGNDVVVCGRDVDVQRLPLPEERGPPDRATPSNPYLRADAALAAGAPPCAADMRGCTVGVGGPVIVAAVTGLVTAVSDGIADAKVRKARRTSGTRVAIPLDEPTAAGR